MNDPFLEKFNKKNPDRKLVSKVVWRRTEGRPIPKRRFEWVAVPIYIGMVICVGAMLGWLGHTILSNIKIRGQLKDLEQKVEEMEVEKERIEEFLDEWAGLFTLADKIIRCESNWNPKAVSPTGCRGLWQFSQATWEYANRKMGRDLDEVDIFDPQDNFKAGLFLLKTEGDGFWRPWSGHCYLN